MYSSGFCTSIGIKTGTGLLPYNRVYNLINTEKGVHLHFDLWGRSKWVSCEKGFIFHRYGMNENLLPWIYMTVVLVIRHISYTICFLPLYFIYKAGALLELVTWKILIREIIRDRQNHTATM